MHWMSLESTKAVIPTDQNKGNRKRKPKQDACSKSLFSMFCGFSFQFYDRFLLGTERLRRTGSPFQRDAQGSTTSGRH